MNCSHCGAPAHSHELERFFKLPDVLFALSEQSARERAVLTADCCTLDRNRFFLRGVLYLPVPEAERKFGIGFWAETSDVAFRWYVSRFDQDLTGQEPGFGTLANSFQRPGYGPTLGLKVKIHWGTASERPTFVVDEAHALRSEQTNGITMKRVHELLALPN